MMKKVNLPWEKYDKRLELEPGYYLVARKKQVCSDDYMKYCEIVSLPYYKEGSKHRTEYLQYPDLVLENSNYPDGIELSQSGFYETKGPYLALVSDITHYVKIEIPDNYDGDMQDYDRELKAYLLGNLIYGSGKNKKPF